MSYLLNEATSFTDEMVEGFVDAHPDVVRRVHGGVVRATATAAGQVAVVVGGGSGHFPAFAGLVGPGLAHGAAMGHVFASPSTQQVYSVAREAASDAGVLLSYGNYAGDRLNFDLAQDRLNEEGVPTRTVVVTDDISSAPADEIGLRRGVAGDLTVFRAAAWAAEQGRALDDVWALADRANRRTRTLGVAFSGCTLPGAAEPLFRVKPGTMAIGMGIHGEPGIEERLLSTADGLAELLVERLLVEQDQATGDSARVGVIVNGLGSVKAEELYVLWKGIGARLRGAGLEPVSPEIGEFATSFEMAGVSLTITWLDDELERAWRAPSGAPGFRRGSPMSMPGPARVSADAARPTPVTAPAPASAASRRLGASVAAALAAGRRAIDANVDELGRMDAVAGDGDHGLGMQRGGAAAAQAAEDAVAQQAGAHTVMVAAADAWADKAGGTSGALWGLGLRAAATMLDDQAVPEPSSAARAAQEAAAEIMRVGKAEPGDKTMLDALLPFAERLSREIGAGSDLVTCWRRAAEAATVAARATADLQPRVGRARTHAHSSVGAPDPGAVSLALIASAVAAAISERTESA